MPNKNTHINACSCTNTNTPTNTNTDVNFFPSSLTHNNTNAMTMTIIIIDSFICSTTMSTSWLSALTCLPAWLVEPWQTNQHTHTHTNIYCIYRHLSLTYARSIGALWLITKCQLTNRIQARIHVFHFLTQLDTGSTLCKIISPKALAYMQIQM